MSDGPVVSTLNLDILREGDVAMVRCRGRLVTGVNTTLHAEISKLIPVCKRIVLDLSELAFMDSSGLGTLVRLCVSARSAGCRLELINLGDRIRQLLELSNLLSVFGIVGEHGIRMN